MQELDKNKEHLNSEFQLKLDLLKNAQNEEIRLKTLNEEMNKHVNGMTEKIAEKEAIVKELRQQYVSFIRFKIQEKSDA